MDYNKYNNLRIFTFYSDNTMHNQTVIITFGYIKNHIMIYDIPTIIINSSKKIIM